MLYCTLIQVGKTKDAYLEAGIREFEKRLSSSCKMTVKTLREEAVGTSDQIHKGRIQESEAIKNAIPAADYVVYLDVRGIEMSSEKFAEFLEKKAEEGKHLTFIIGGAFGIEEKVLKERIDFRISFSPMTFTHQMIRLLFLEQVYRAQTIISGKPYHH